MRGSSGSAIAGSFLCRLNMTSLAASLVLVFHCSRVARPLLPMAISCRSSPSTIPIRTWMYSSVMRHASSMRSATFRTTCSFVSWVSLVMVVPVMIYYVLTSMMDGYEANAYNKIARSREEAIIEVAKSEDGRKLASISNQLPPIAEIGGLFAETEAKITWGFTEDELRQIDDASKACID